MDKHVALLQPAGIAFGGFFAPGSLLIMLILFTSNRAPYSPLGYFGSYLTGYSLIGAIFLVGNCSIGGNFGNAGSSIFSFRQDLRFEAG